MKIFLCRSENYNKCKCVDYEKPIAKDKLSVFQNLFRIYSKLLYGYDTSFVSLLRALQALLFFPFSRLSDNRKDRKTPRESEEWSQKERRQSKRFAVTGRKMFTRQNQLFRFERVSFAFEELFLVSASIRNNVFLLNSFDRLSVKRGNDPNDPKQTIFLLLLLQILFFESCSLIVPNYRSIAITIDYYFYSL